MWRVTVSSRRSRAFGSRSREAGVARSSFAIMAGVSSGLLGGTPVSGDLAERRYPDARRVLDVVEQLPQARQARRPADDLRVKGEVGDAVRFGDAVELRDPSLEHRPRRLDAPLAREHEEGRVVQHPPYGDLDQRSAVSLRVQ